MPTNTQKALLDKDTIELIEAGYLSEDLKITSTCIDYMNHLAFIANKTALVKRATEKNKEAKAKEVVCK